MTTDAQRKNSSRPGDGRQALHYTLSEVFRGEVTILEQGAGFYLDVTNWTKFLDKCAKRMEGANGLQKYFICHYNIIDGLHTSRETYVSLNACNKELIGIRLRVWHEIEGGLFCGNRNERYALVGRLEPDNLRALNRATRFVTAISFSFTTLSLLLLLRGSRGRTQ